MIDGVSKKHRDQKEKRCRMLEDELYQLYARLTKAEEVRSLQFENEVLKDIMARHSIPLPPDLLPRKSALAEVTIFGESSSHQHLQVKMPEYQPYHVASQYCPSSAEEDKVQNSQFPLDELPEYLQRPSYHPDNRKFAQMGVDFVLSLERPCLFHTRPLGTEEPSGHALSMQGLLLSEAPSGLHDKSSWEIPAQQLDKLFELSGSLGLNGYITPVQTWNRIMDRFIISKIPNGKLDMLRSAMIPHIKCYGFGALIEEDIFEGLLDDILPSRP
ncbi:hypothetical protein N7474_009713 [Penicillium riverlandense]|uniref:uncharacterized protein n=1 Tax=Penicillium riverlandense TaxID=1903569 RepID=UPI0025488C9A|nr:uncharacterized protein N7474_009713 [Penicillium riverlandense]KAJ5808444.1 hypothetical protein N7474_009713 [Penicillium riverlandense]